MAIWNRARLRQRQGVRRLTRVGEVWVRADNGQPEIMRLGVRYKFPGVDGTCRECGYHEHKQGCSKYACPRCRGFANTHASWCELGPKDESAGAPGLLGPSCPQGTVDALVEQPKGKPCPTCGWVPQLPIYEADCGFMGTPSYPPHLQHHNAWKASGALPGWHAHTSWPEFRLGTVFKRNDNQAAVWYCGFELGRAEWATSPPTGEGDMQFGVAPDKNWGRAKIATAQEAMFYADEQLAFVDQRVPAPA